MPLETPSATELIIGHNVASKAEVDAVMKQAEAVAVIVKPAQNTFWGAYAGYFQEVTWNPQWPLPE